MPAFVGDREFASLNEAIDAAADGQTVVVIDSVTVLADPGVLPIINYVAQSPCSVPPAATEQAEPGNRIRFREFL